MDNISSDRLLKMRIAMMEFRFHAEHIPHRRNAVADYLSRYGSMDEPEEADLDLVCDTEDREFVVAAASCLTFFQQPKPRFFLSNASLISHPPQEDFNFLQSRVKCMEI